MRLENFRIETADRLTKSVATVVWETREHPPQDIYFATTPKFSQDLSCNPHTFLVACIAAAMRFGEQRLFLDAEICPELKEGLETNIEWMRFWYGGDRQSVTIEAKPMRSPTPPIPERAAFFFSGGVDSLATLRNNRLRFNPTHPGYLKDGFLIYGIEHYAADDSQEQLDTFDLHVKALHNIAQEAGIELIPVYTNVKSLEDDWTFWSQEFQGGVLTAVAHAFSRRVTRVSIAGSAGIPYLEPYGSHPLLDLNYSSSHLQVHHDCVALTRLDKVKLISHWPIALDNLKVCYLNPPNRLNCGTCAKCVRTMIALQAIGKLAEADAFTQSDMSEGLIAQRANIADDQIEACFTELIGPLTDQGRFDLVKGIKRASNHYRGRDLKGAIKRLDRELLGGSLRTWREKRRAQASKAYQL